MKVKFLPQDISIEIDSNKSVMELAKENQIAISSSCNGMCSCAECRVYVVDGEAHVLPPSVRETELIGGAHFINNRRLSCQLFCFGDVTVDLSEQLERKNNRRQQFLHSKDSTKKSSSLGDILVQQDQDMNKISTEEGRPYRHLDRAHHRKKIAKHHRQAGHNMASSLSARSYLVKKHPPGQEKQNLPRRRGGGGGGR